MYAIRGTGIEVVCDGTDTLEHAMRSAGFTPDSYIYLIGGRPVPMDTVPPADSEVRAMRVASGG